MYSLSLLRIHFEFTLDFENSISLSRIHFHLYLFSRIYFEFPLFFVNSPPFPRIHFKLPLNSIRYKFPICFANPLVFQSKSVSRIHFNYFSVTRMHYLNRECTSFFVKSLSIHHLFHEFIINLLSFTRIHFLSQESTFILPSFPRVHYQFTICFANSL